MDKIGQLIDIVKASTSWNDFKKRVEAMDKPLEEETREPLPEPSDFNKKIVQGLNWNPKEHKK